MARSASKLILNTPVYIVLGLLFIVCSLIQDDVNPWKLRILGAAMISFYVAIVVNRNNLSNKTFFGDLVFNYCVPACLYIAILSHAWSDRVALKQEAARIWRNMFSESSAH